MCKRTIHLLKGILLKVLPNERNNVEIHKKIFCNYIKLLSIILGFFITFWSPYISVNKRPSQKSRSEILLKGVRFISHAIAASFTRAIHCNALVSLISAIVCTCSGRVTIWTMKLHTFSDG